MANTYTTLSALFTAIADAIRQKTGSNGQIVADDFPTEIRNIFTIGEKVGNYEVSGGILSLSMPESEMTEVIAFLVPIESNYSVVTWAVAIRDFSSGYNMSSAWFGQTIDSSRGSVQSGCISISTSGLTATMNWAMDPDAFLANNHVDVYKLTI